MYLYGKDIGSFLLFAGQDTGIDDVTLQDVLEWGKARVFTPYAWRRKIYALKAFFGEYAVESPLDGYSPYVDSFEWANDPVPENDLAAILDPAWTEGWLIRACAIANLLYTGLTTCEILNLLVSDIQLEMGLVANDRGLFPLNPTGKAAVSNWAGIRPQFGPMPLLITTRNGKRGITPEHLRGELARYTLEVTGNKYVPKNFLASRYVFDAKLYNCSPTHLANIWGKTSPQVLSILRHLTDGDFILC
jgi:integrase